MSQASLPNFTGWHHWCSLVWMWVNPWSHLKHLVENLPRRVRAIIVAKASWWAFQVFFSGLSKSDYSVILLYVRMSCLFLDVKNGLANFQLMLIRDGTNIWTILTRDFSQTHKLTVGKLNYLRENTLLCDEKLNPFIKHKICTSYTILTLQGK